jgi:glycosyltransferase involved in cell wall biosynthesis
MKTLILFDQNILHYRQSIYRRFKDEFAKNNLKLVVCYDKKLNNVPDDGLFYGIDYTFSGFNQALKQHQAKTIILFVWLKYKFLFPFMIASRLKGIKQIIWTHGAHLQAPKKMPNRLFHILRHWLSSAHVIYSDNELKYIVGCRRKVFVAYNTLNFNDFPIIEASQDALKKKYNVEGQQVILTVGRWNDMNRKPEYLPQLMDNFMDKNVRLFVVGPGLSAQQTEQLESHPSIKCFGAVYDQVVMNELYKLCDLFVMPGAIGLAINQAFYHAKPVIIENVLHSPEVCYLQEGKNGYQFSEGDIVDFADKVTELLNNDSKREAFGQYGKHVIDTQGSFETMCASFIKFINWVNRN